MEKYLNGATPYEWEQAAQWYNDARHSAVREVLAKWGREVVSLESVAPTESGRGTVYRVTLA
jgi:hypothetical protein